MGCVSSHLLNQDDDFTQIGHHIVSLTSTTYGLLTLDPSSSPTTIPPTPPPRFTLSSFFPSPEPKFNPQSPEVINSWELMAGLDSTPETFRFAPQQSKPSAFRVIEKTPPNKDPPAFQPNQNPNNKTPNFDTFPTSVANLGVLDTSVANLGVLDFLDCFEKLCPPNGEDKVVIYTTTLRGVRKTFEACNAVRAVFEGFRVFFCERDISMDRGFREEMWELMKGKDKDELVPPRVFVKGRYVGGSDEVLRLVEEGCFGKLVEGLPKSKPGYVCEVCGGSRFLPCDTCNGSCKMVMVLKDVDGEELGKTVRVQCSDCNENGLVRCPICS